MTPREIIAVICPELYSAPSLEAYLSMASDMTDRGFFGGRYSQAAALRAAHLFTAFSLSNSSGGTVDALRELGGGAPVASVGEGKLSVSFAQSGAGNGAGSANLGSTKYGRELLGLIKSRPRTGVNSAGLAGGFLR
jgi:hypothetical protein